MPRRALLLALALLAAAPAPPPRLARERSRYLIEHADGPVQWYPWGSEAFAKAQREAKPIFLSIGYASCHWCHVMDRESFRSPAVAEVLNRDFVPILVDREEHPDVDAAYITFVEAATGGSAGWPANLILTPDLRPLTGASYMPPETLQRLLAAIAGQWQSDRPRLLAGGDQLLTLARTLGEPAAAPADVPPEALATVLNQARDVYDRPRGGFGSGAKFPQPMLLDFLLRYSLRPNDVDARSIAVATLHAMADGTLHDQVGGGFHRYTVDPDWRLPHFEKMLYDQALLTIVYTEAWQITKDDSFRDVARDTLGYALRDLKTPKGAAFESSQDSESLIPRGGRPQSVEGVFYAWSEGELRRLLGRDADLAAYYYGIKPGGNVPEQLDPRGELRGLNLLSVVHSRAMARNEFGLTDAALDEKLAQVRARMLEARSKRPQPFRDDKIVAGWNGLMISALARAGLAFDEPLYTGSAERAAAAVTSQLIDAKTRRLYRTARAGKAGIDALPEDYAYLIQGLLDTFEASYDVRWLELAIELQQKQDELFWDGSRYTSGKSLPEALRGLAAESDSPLPSANAVSAMNLLRLGEMVDSAPWREKSGAVFRSFAARLQSSPIDLAAMASAYFSSMATPKQIVVSGEARSDAGHALMRPIGETFLLHRVVMVARTDAARQRLAQYVPVVAEMKPIEKKPTAYVCERFVCKAPTTDPEELRKLLNAK